MVASRPSRLMYDAERRPDSWNWRESHQPTDGVTLAVVMLALTPADAPISISPGSTACAAAVAGASQSKAAMAASCACFIAREPCNGEA